MTVNPLLVPVLALIAWTIVMLFWAVFRIQTAARAKDSGLDVNNLPRGARARDVEPHFPPEVSWPRQNYEHLVEQPTLFYALTLAIVLMGGDDLFAVICAWAYVGFRILHSVMQAQGKSRMIGFVGSTFALLGLLGYAVGFLLGAV